MLRDMCRNFADNELAPHAAEWDKNHTFPSHQVKCCGKIKSSLGLWGVH